MNKLHYAIINMDEYNGYFPNIPSTVEGMFGKYSQYYMLVYVFVVCFYMRLT